MMMKITKQGKGRLVVVDGIDGSGKATQAKLLAGRLRQAGHRVKQVEFPRYYENFFGRLVADCLSGKRGDFSKLDPYIASVIFAADRWETAPKISQWLEEGMIVMADRYATANQIHQAGKITDGRKRKQLLAWLEKLEYETFQIPRPDLVLLLDVPAAQGKELSRLKPAAKKKYLAGRKDLHENDLLFQERSRRSALSVAKQNGWLVVNCLRHGRMMTKKEISDIIWGKVGALIKKPSR